ncbi:MAG: hypothetical protein J3K34DRAFT_432184 [Monoraphidium minutum]|nr:MAG: hypothetical protein J3K34DRAFT_432184 [Monoraphidium minutum]
MSSGWGGPAARRRPAGGRPAGACEGRGGRKARARARRAPGPRKAGARPAGRGGRGSAASPAGARGARAHARASRGTLRHPGNQAGMHGSWLEWRPPGATRGRSMAGGGRCGDAPRLRRARPPRLGAWKTSDERAKRPQEPKSTAAGARRRRHTPGGFSCHGAVSGRAVRPRAARRAARVRPAAARVYQPGFSGAKAKQSSGGARAAKRRCRRPSRGRGAPLSPRILRAKRPCHVDSKFGGH